MIYHHSRITSVFSLLCVGTALQVPPATAQVASQLQAAPPVAAAGNQGTPTIYVRESWAVAEIQGAATAPTQPQADAAKENQGTQKTSDRKDAAVAEDNGTETVAALPVQIAPDNKLLQFSGRFDRTNPAVALSAWSASSISLRFRGSAVTATLGLGENRFNVVLDGAPLKRITGKAGDSQDTPEVRTYSLAKGLPEGEHTIVLFKNTEANVGNASFGGFQLPQDGVALPLSLPRRKIEVIGDSISAGYGIEGANQNEHFTPATENAYLTYGALAARALNADYTCIAWSGRTMWPTNTVPEVYNRTLPRSTTSVWKDEAPLPDAYLINLATNEFGRPQNPDEDGWVKAYRDFIGGLRQKAPQATIYCALSPMLTDDWPPQRQVRSTARSYLQRVVRESNATGDSKVHYLEFAMQNATQDGLGSDWHPNVKTNQIMAEKFVAALKTDLKW